MKQLVESLLVFGLSISLCLAGNNDGVSSLIEQSRQGDTRAMCDLALAYYHGDGVLKDPFKAKCWAKKAHDQGSRRAGKIWEELSLWQYSGKCDLSFDDEPSPQYRSGERYREPVTGIIFVWVAGGCFSMGCHGDAGRCEKNEMPAHRVCLDGFWMATFEVTQGQWEAVMGTNPSRFVLTPEHPVEQVSFEDVRNFIRTLKADTGVEFSLPTEAQWEYACRNGGRKIPYPWGKEAYLPEENCGTCNVGTLRGRTAATGSFLPNDMGLYDMGGNVREWCRDVYDKNAYATQSPDNPLHRKEGKERVVRGGSFVDNTDSLRCSARQSAIPNMKSAHIGFRLVLKREDR
ncbi:MAG: SUMF1/EgtB/PvdO family nonheme iron enzyme [Proteobacteria bacterium]|nr:SUMF1/EgtB/PvdOfamily nonheme iron enzyme [Desulfobacula sp.]MBU3952305.1 SUMF1/EgtB/PvdO family nonheme iron enzyme [Pseudomonadota bacterium]MBU4131916.1 SUMF1/EgtB/PvdO family nonheme iron enzyme [Pseudomonadota bacterium]